MITESQSLPLLSLVLFWAITLYWGWKSSKGEPLHIRSLPQIEAIDDGIGRAAEMGRPCYHLPGAYTTARKAWITVAIAGINVMRYVAYKAAVAGVPFVVGAITEDLLPLMDDTVRGAYIEAGRVDEYDSVEQVKYIGDKQAARTAIPGFIMRGRPAYVSLIGSYASDFLYGAETAKALGAIVISGDARMSQISVMAICSDYFLCGEEIYAASAYVSKDKSSIGAIVGNDFCELAFIGFTVLMFLLVNIGFETGVRTLMGW